MTACSTSKSGKRSGSLSKAIPRTRRNQVQTVQVVSAEVDSWIAEEELPTSAALKVIRTNSLDFRLTQDEIQERNEFISWYMMQDFKVLLLVPATEYATETEFFSVPEYTFTDSGYSAFNTVDFQKNRPEFDTYACAMRKIMERGKDLAVIHSSARAFIG
jgi:hypothetical protein